VFQLITNLISSAGLKIESNKLEAIRLLKLKAVMVTRGKIINSLFY